MARDRSEGATIPKVTQAYVEARRQKILTAAVACFSKNGLHRTSMLDIVDRAGLSAGSVYIYFDSKEQIIEAIAAGRLHRERKLLEAARPQKEHGSTIKNLLRNFYAVLLDPSERLGRRLSIQLWAEALRNSRVHRTVQDGVQIPREMLIDLLRDARRRGELDETVDCEGLSRVLIALYQGFALQAALEPSASLEPSLRVVEQLLEAALHIKSTRKPL